MVWSSGRGCDAPISSEKGGRGECGAPVSDVGGVVECCGVSVVYVWLTCLMLWSK